MDDVADELLNLAVDLTLAERAWWRDEETVVDDDAECAAEDAAEDDAECATEEAAEDDAEDDSFALEEV